MSSSALCIHHIEDNENDNWVRMGDDLLNKKSALMPQAVSFLPFFNFPCFDLSAFSFAPRPTSIWVSLSYAAQQKAQEELGEQQKQQWPGAQDLSSHTLLPFSALGQEKKIACSPWNPYGKVVLQACNSDYCKNIWEQIAERKLEVARRGFKTSNPTTQYALQGEHHGYLLSAAQKYG